MALLAVPPVYQALALSALLGWPVPMFRYLYDRMHKRNFWMTLKTQRRHDLRHRSAFQSAAHNSAVANRALPPIR